MSSLRGRTGWIVSLVAIVAVFAIILTMVLSGGPKTESNRPVSREQTSSVSSDRGTTAPISQDYRLVDVTDELGIDFVQNPGFPSFFLPEVMGSGVALFDFDQDGRLDIFFRNGTPGPPHPLGLADTPHTFGRLYHQLPTGKFEDVSAESGLMVGDYGTGVAIGDVNNDGLPDI